MLQKKIKDVFHSNSMNFKLLYAYVLYLEIGSLYPMVPLLIGIQRVLDEELKFKLLYAYVFYLETGSLYPKVSIDTHS